MDYRIEPCYNLLDELLAILEGLYIVVNLRISNLTINS